MACDLKSINLTREALHEKVWTTPINAIAKQYSVRDHDIINLCDKNNIPRPPCGYWSKFRHGFRIDRPSLPTSAQAKSLEKQCHPEQKRIFRDKPIHHNEKFKLLNDPPKSVGPPHPLITKTYRAYEAIHPDKTDRLRSKEQALYVWVGYRSLDRALTVMDLLIKELETRNYSVSIENRSSEYWTTQANIDGEKVPFHIEEGSAKKPIPANEPTQRWRANAYEHVTTGILSLLIDNFMGESRQKSWSDTKTKPLEQRLPEIIDGLVEAAAKIKVIRIENEKRLEQTRIEEERRRKIEEDERAKKEQIAQLDPCSQSWEKALRIRRFIAALETAAIEKLGQIEPGGGLASLIEIAKSHADSIDPILNTLKSLGRDPQP